MKHLYEGTLTGCDTLEDAEENYLLDARMMELRERRIQHSGWNVGIKACESHLDGLKKLDPEMYATYLYYMSRLQVVLSDCSDEQIRNVLNGQSRAMGLLYWDRDGLADAATVYRKEHQATTEMLQRVRERIHALLPALEETVTEYAHTEREEVVRRKISDGIYTGGVDPEEPVSPTIALAALHLRTLVYIRHPTDLIREIIQHQVAWENCE